MCNISNISSTEQDADFYNGQSIHSDDSVNEDVKPCQENLEKYSQLVEAITQCLFISI